MLLLLLLLGLLQLWLQHLLGERLLWRLWCSRVLDHVLGSICVRMQARAGRLNRQRLPKVVVNLVHLDVVGDVVGVAVVAEADSGVI